MMGSLLLALVIGTVTFISLTLMGMPYALLLAVVAGVMELVPMIGPFIAAVPAVLIALPRGWETAVLVAGLYLIIQQLENNLLVPRIMSSQVNLPSVLVVIALLVGGSLLGIIGAILSVPAAAVVQILWLRVIVPWLKGVEQHWGTA
jgi:predicted PurR-regulated permease PerM